MYGTHATGNTATLPHKNLLVSHLPNAKKKHVVTQLNYVTCFFINNTCKHQ